MLSILDWEEAWRQDKPFPFTPSVAEMNGLDAALDHYLAEGPEKVWARHALTAKACRAGVKAMGLSLWAGQRGDRLADQRRRCACPTASTTRRCAEPRAPRYGVVFSAGRGETMGKLIAHRPYGAGRRADLCGRRA